MTLMVANLAYTATLSRLLAPAAFGLVAVANLVVLFVQFFARMGLGSALVQKPDLSEEEIRAASTAGIAVGLACMVLVWILAPALAALFRAPGLPPVLRGLSVSFVFMGWSMTGLGLLRRELRFRTLSIILAGTYVFAYLVVGVGLALLGAGVWSLVAASVTHTAALAIAQYAILRHPLRPVLRWEPYQAVCGYGTRLAGAHLLDYGGSNLDTLTVSRVASTAVLGQYTRAYYLVFQPLTNYLAQALTNVLFSTLSRIQQDLDRLHRAYFSILSIGNLMLFPICAGIAVAAHELVLVVLGPQWNVAVGLVPWFALAGGCHVVSQLTQLLADARGAEPVARCPGGLHRGAGPAPADGVPLPVRGGLGVRRGRGRRGAAPVRCLPRPRPARPGHAVGSDVGGARSGGVRQCRRGPGRRRRQVGAD